MVAHQLVDYQNVTTAINCPQIQCALRSLVFIQASYERIACNNCVNKLTEMIFLIEHKKHIL